MTPPAEDTTHEGTANEDATDPILERRAQFSRGADLGKRLGYTAFLVAMIAFFIGIFTGFNDTWGWIVIASLLIGSLFLLPAIIVGYAVKAADREDMGLPSGH